MHSVNIYFFSPMPDEVVPPPAPSPHPLPGTLVSTHTGIKKHGVLFGPMHETKPPRSMSAASKVKCCHLIMLYLGL